MEAKNASSGDIFSACVETTQPGLVLYLNPRLKVPSRAMALLSFPRSSLYSMDPSLWHRTINYVAGARDRTRLLEGPMLTALPPAWMTSTLPHAQVQSDRHALHAELQKRKCDTSSKDVTNLFPSFQGFL
jgi:hypothetical protein